MYSIRAFSNIWCNGIQIVIFSRKQHELVNNERGQMRNGKLESGRLKVENLKVKMKQWKVEK